MATPVSNLSLIGGLGAAVAIILSVSGACDKAIDQRITDKRNLSLSEHASFEGRIARLERWQDREAK